MSTRGWLGALALKLKEKGYQVQEEVRGDVVTKVQVTQEDVMMVIDMYRNVIINKITIDDLDQLKDLVGDLIQVLKELDKPPIDQENKPICPYCGSVMEVENTGEDAYGNECWEYFCPKCNYSWNNFTGFVEYEEEEDWEEWEDEDSV